MRIFKPVFAGLLPLFLVTGPSRALAQQPLPAAEAKKPTEEEKKKLREKALMLLDETLADTQALTIPANRIVLLAEILPCLWERDPAKAREAATTLVMAIVTQEGPPPPNEDDDFEGQTYGFRGRADGNYRLYTQMISKIGNADPQTALDLLTSTRGTMTATRPERAKVLDELTGSLEIAAAAKNPQKLYEIAKRNLEKDDFERAIRIVSDIAQRDPALAGRLFGEIIPKVATLPDEMPLKITSFLQLAALLPKEKGNEPPKDTPGRRPTRAGAKPTVDENQRRALFVAFGQTLSNLLKKSEAAAKADPETEQGIFNPEFSSRDRFRPFLPDFQRYAPRVAEQLKEQITPEENDGRSGTNWEKDLLKRFAERKVSEEEVEIVTQGVFPRLVFEGRVEEARKIIDQTPDPAVRERLTRQLETAEAMKVAQSDKAGDADAARLLEQTKSAGQRFRLLIALAEKAVTRKDEKRATELLDQALTLTGQIQNPRVQITSRMAVAAVFVKVAPNRALDIYEPLVDKLNEFLGGAVIMGTYLNLGGAEPVRGNEFNLETSNGLGELIPTNLIPLELLAKADFERTRALIDRIRFPEIRAKFRIDILKAVLLPEEPPTDPPADAPPAPEKKTETAP